jgi:hypothetical protein
VEVITREWKRQDETTYSEEETNPTFAISGKMIKDSGDPSISRYRTALRVDVEENDDNNGKETKAIYFRDKPIAGNDTAKRDSRKKRRTSNLHGIGH